MQPSTCDCTSIRSILDAPARKLELRACISSSARIRVCMLLKRSDALNVFAHPAHLLPQFSLFASILISFLARRAQIRCLPRLAETQTYMRVY